MKQITAFSKNEDFLEFLGLTEEMKNIRHLSFDNSIFVYTNGMIHNEFGPARLDFCPSTGKLKIVRYMLNNRLSRVNAPAYVKYNNDGLIINEAFYLNGYLHNSAGPALRVKTMGNNVWCNYYYIHGKELKGNRLNNLIYKSNNI